MENNNLYSSETEEALLGLLIKNPSLITKSYGRVSPDHFYIEENRLIYNALIETFKSQEKIDPILLIDKLKETKNNEKYWRDLIPLLILKSGIESNFSEYLDKIVDKKLLRDLNSKLKDSIKFLSDSKSSKTQELVEHIEEGIFSVTKDRELKDFLSIEELTNLYLEKLKRIKEYGYFDGIRVKLKALDDIIGGFKKGEFIVLAGRPSMGKTAVALQFIYNIPFDKTVGLFSLEMPAESIIQRFISNDSMVSQDELRNYDGLNQNKLLRVSNSIETLKKRSLWIDDTPGIKVGELTWKIRKLNSETKLDIVFIDYLQLIESENNKETRQQSISYISRTLKSLARELDIPIIALSQLSRKVESREEKKPMMSDLRESGAIEQDADVVLLLYRPKYYNNEDIDFEKIVVEELDIIVAKNRNGKTGTIVLDINMEIGRITTSNNFER